MTIRISVDSGDADERFRRLRSRVTDLRPVFRGPIDKHVSSVFRRQFATEGGFGGRPWQRLKPETLAAKRRIRRERMGKLRRFNRLWGSLVKVGPQSVRRIRAQSYERGTRIPYAAAHQTGVPKRNLPKRQVVPDPMPRSVVRVWDRMIARRLEGR